jgi:broad specificity phosphatase PhoE
VPVSDEADLLPSLFLNMNINFVLNATQEDDSKQVLTALGREQAELTGKRLAELVQGVNEAFGPCNVKYVRVSNLTRAKQTAEIIAKYLPGIPMTEPDVNLNEGR